MGMALVPLRGVTVASNFTFVFLALIIGVAELGGRGPALATAVSSALSLNFFLTEPYQRLTISSRDDVIAFVGLAGCGLLAAFLGAQRNERKAALRAAQGRLALLHTGLDQLESARPLDERMAEVLEALRAAGPVEAAVLRDTHDRVLGASKRAHALPVPERVLEPHGVLPPIDARVSGRPKSVRLPRDGRRVAVLVMHRQVGWLDVWGTGAAGAVALGALSEAARLLGLLMAGTGSSSGTATGSNLSPP
jgi:hypothetical protein